MKRVVLALALVALSSGCNGNGENHYFKCQWAGWKDSTQCKNYTPPSK